MRDIELSNPDNGKERKMWSSYRSLTRYGGLLVFCLCFSLLIHFLRIFLFLQADEKVAIPYQYLTNQSYQSHAPEEVHNAIFKSSMEEGARENLPQQILQARLGFPRRGSPTFMKDKVKKFFYVNPRPSVRDKTSFQGCQYKACKMTSILEEADVLLFNAARMKKVKKLPAKRDRQIWVMYSREPTNLRSMDALGLHDLVNKVNFSRMIYSDSTWPVLYGVLEERPLPQKNYTKIFQQKDFEVAWFVSQCDRPSRRMEYVKRMMSTVNVHIYGKCGNLTCGQKGYRMGGKKLDCLDLLSSRYKFYLSFENTFCRDYVSEKFFNMFEDVDIIPVARGGADYNKLFPPGIFINTNDFLSPESLGSYLHNLAQDEQNYVAMLKEKNRYLKGTAHDKFFCDLCKIAHTGEPRHVYENFFKWVRKPGSCWEPTDLKPL